MLVAGITTNNLSQTATNFSGPVFGEAKSTETEVRLPVPVAGTVANLTLSLSGEPVASGKSYAFTIMKNGEATGVTCTVGAGALTCSDAVNSAAFTAGQPIALRSVPSGNPAARTIRWSVTLTQ
jgi:hypothetical protein